MKQGECRVFVAGRWRVAGPSAAHAAEPLGAAGDEVASLGGQAVFRFGGGGALARGIGRISAISEDQSRRKPLPDVTIKTGTYTGRAAAYLVTTATASHANDFTAPARPRTYVPYLKVEFHN